MKLLIVTQVVDKNHPILGFFHRWIEEFAKNCEKVTVICLQKGEYSLPDNVEVYSLGKEEGKGRLVRLWRFYTYIWTLRHQYDSVFVHMNPHYIVLAWWYWKLYGSKIFFWRNHAKMNWKTLVAIFFSEKVFYTSPYACTSRYKHAYQMPVGVDETLFSNHDTNKYIKKNTILFLGRLSKIKQPEIFIDTSVLLPEYLFHIYGDDPSESGEYARELKKRKGHVAFFSSVKNNETVYLYQSHELYINLTPKGSMDKTVIEAIFSGALVLVSNDSFRNILPDECIIENPTPEKLATKISFLLNLSDAKKNSIRNSAKIKAVSEHSLQKLSHKLYNNLI